MKRNHHTAMQRFGAASSLSTGLAAIVLTMSMGTAVAADSGYIGTRVGISDGGVDSRLGSSSDGTAGELFGGFRLNERWAIELGFFGIDADLGRHPGWSEPIQTLRNRSKFRGTALSARYEVPMGSRTRLHLRAGLTDLNLDYKSRYRYSIDDGASAPIVRESGFEMSSNSLGSVLALGVDTALNDIWSVGAELQSYRGDMRLKEDRDDMGGWRVALDRTGSVQTAVLSLTASF